MSASSDASLGSGASSAFIVEPRIAHRPRQLRVTPQRPLRATRQFGHPPLQLPPRPPLSASRPSGHAELPRSVACLPAGPQVQGPPSAWTCSSARACATASAAPAAQIGFAGAARAPTQHRLHQLRQLARQRWRALVPPPGPAWQRRRALVPAPRRRAQAGRPLPRPIHAARPLPRAPR